MQPHDTDMGPAAASVVDTGSGRLKGRADDGIARFLGIPYGKPPLGEGRFRPPVAYGGWDGTREALEFAPSAPQLADLGFYPGDPQAMHAERMDEDCLYLNVWAPEAPGCYPVLVWLHGGSQVIGGTSRPVYDGAAFARSGIVCVTVGHRLGLLGLLECGEVLGPDYADSGNSALRDQVLALQWVKDHIAAFDGDPGRVTIGGESAGGKNVAALMSSPAAEGLFHAAIVVSGGADTVSSCEEAHALARLALERSGLAPGDLLTAPWPHLMQAQARVLADPPRNLPFRPVVGGEMLPDHPLTTIAAGRGAAVPLLIGTSRDECLPMLRAAGQFRSWKPSMLGHTSPQRMSVIEERGLTAWPEKPLDLLRLNLLTAEAYALPLLRLAEAHSGAGHPVWMYRNDQAQADGPFRGFAPHVSDLGWIWNRPDAIGSLPEGHAARGLHRTFAEFIRDHKAPWRSFDDRRSMALLRQTLCIAEDPLAPIDALFGTDR